MEECRQDVECTAITFKEVHGGCGFHKGAIQIISNAHWENIVQETGFTCFERQGKVFDNMFVISFTIKLLRNGLITHLLNYILGAAGTLALTLGGRRRRSVASGNNICTVNITI